MNKRFKATCLTAFVVSMIAVPVQASLVENFPELFMGACLVAPAISMIAVPAHAVGLIKKDVDRFLIPLNTVSTLCLVVMAKLYKRKYKDLEDSIPEVADTAAANAHDVRFGRLLGMRRWYTAFILSLLKKSNYLLKLSMLSTFFVCLYKVGTDVF